MRIAKILATAAVCSTLVVPALAQNMTNHDTGTGGAASSGAGRLSGTNNLNEDPYYTAMRLLHHEKYADAIPFLDAALANKPKSAKLLSYEGYAHTMVGQYGESLDYLHQALASDPDYQPAHQYLGELYLAMKDPDSANGQLAELTRLCPSGCDERDALQKDIAAYQPPVGK
jgi:tetratricopeptide (TPR) repeat protein